MSFKVFADLSDVNASNIINEVKSELNSNKPEPSSSNIVYHILESKMEIFEKNLPVVEINRSHFLTGTLRIKQSGYYKLTENIVFNPNPSTWDGVKLVGNDWNPTPAQTGGGPTALYPIMPFGPYHLGFFAAIAVEANNVIIDLNGFSLSQSVEHYLQQRFFSLIELASSPFIPTQGPSNFGTTVFFPQYVKVKNGNLGLSSHQGIHGNGMKNIILEDLNIFDYEQAGIGLNGGENMIIRNVCIGKNSRNVFVSAAYSQSRFVRSFLRTVINGGDPSITIQGISKTGSQILSELVTEMDSVYKDVIIDKVVPTSTLFKNESLILDGSVYGLLLNVMGVAVNGFLQSLNNTTGNKNIYIQNLNVNNLDSAPVEVIGLSTDDVSQTYGLPAQKGPVGDVFRILDVSDPNTYYIPDVLSNAQCYLSKYGHASVDSSIYDTWIATANIPLGPLITDNYFICGGDSMAHVMKGNIGIFLSGTQDLEMYNVVVKNIINRGKLGEVDKCPPNTPVYDGNRTRGIAVIVNKNLYIKGLQMDTVKSKTADAIGIDFIGSTDKVTIENFNIMNIEQGDVLDGGAHPNVSPDCHLFNNKQNVSQLTLTPVL